MDNYVLAVVGFASWLLLGATACRYDYRHAPFEGSDTPFLWFIMLIAGPLGWLYHAYHHGSGMGQRPRVCQADRNNPMFPLLSEAIRLRRSLEDIPGTKAKRRRQELDGLVKELRAMPRHLEEQDAQPYLELVDEQLLDLMQRIRLELLISAPVDKSH